MIEPMGWNKFSVVFFVAMIVTACGGGGSSTSSGTNKIAIGKITGFGSVYVNGVKYETDSTRFEVDESLGSQSDLQVGMVVRIAGTVNKDGVTGVAESLEFDNDLEGPVSNAPVADPDGETKTFSVLGVTVVVNSTNTVFDDNTPGFNFDSIAQNDVVEVSGFFNAGSVTLYATYIEKQGVFDAGNPAGTDVEVEGELTNLNEVNMTFNIGVVTVSYDGSTALPNGGLSNGLDVEVEGVLQSSTTILAAEVELEDDGFPSDAGEVEIQGLVTAFTNLANIEVAGQLVDASGVGVEFEPSSLADPGAIEIGMEIEVEGALVGSTLIAAEVKQRGAEIQVAASVDSIDAGAESITFDVGPGTVTVTIDTALTEFEDEVEDSDTFSLGDIVAGDFITTEAISAGTLYIAKKVKRESSGEKIKVEAPVDSFDEAAGTVTLLGVTFGTDGSTDFEADDVDFASAADFFMALSLGDTLEVEDEISNGMATGDGIAESIEIED